MLHLVRTASPYTVIILAIFTLVLKLQSLGQAIVPVADAHHAFFGLIVSLLKNVLGSSAAGFTLFAMALTFGQALYLIGIARRHRIFTKHTYVPAFAYLVLSSLHPALGQFSVQLLVNWLLLGALDTVLHFSKRDQPQRTIFNAGFLLACAALLHFPAIVFFLFFVLALLWLRSFKPGEWVVGVLGYITPFYFAACLLYLFDAWALVKNWPHWGNGIPQKGQQVAYLIVIVSGCFILMASGVAVLFRTFFRMPVSVRRGWGAIGTAMLVCLAVSALTPRAEGAAWLAALPPMALLVIPPMLGEKRSRFATFVFYFMLVLVVTCQLVLHR